MKRNLIRSFSSSSTKFHRTSINSKDYELEIIRNNRDSILGKIEILVETESKIETRTIYLEDDMKISYKKVKHIEIDFSSCNDATVRLFQIDKGGFNEI